jgi:D-apionolactonase
VEKNILYYGKNQDLPRKTFLKAGELDLVYEGGFLRYMKLGGHEVLRMINYAVRDHNWETIPLFILNEKMDLRNNSFSIQYQSEARKGDIHFLWNCSIEGKADSTITFTIRGEAKTAFKRNRIGFTVLHPVKECVGKETLITHDEGDREKRIFPEMISPHQPFINIRAMEWPLPNGKAVIEFSGDVFETEDQRNWTDDSFKTYCTPLSLPFPVTVNIGDVVEQRITLSIKDGTSQRSATDDKKILTVDQNAVDLAKLGIGCSSGVDKLSDQEIDLLKSVPFDHYQADVKLYEDWHEKLVRAIDESKSLGFPLELSLFFENVDEELTKLQPFVQQYRPDVKTINIFNKFPHSTQNETIRKVLPALKTMFPAAKIGGGTNAFFTELNRDRPPMELLDFVVYSTNPQVHAFDNDSLVETVNALPYTVKTAKSFSNGKPVHVSPITLKMRWNPNATGESKVAPGQLPPDVDVRQMSLFGASWTLGVLSNLISSGVGTLTFFEAIGTKGIAQSKISKFPEQFHAPAGTVYPMFFLFKFLLQNKHFKFYPVASSHPLQFGGLVLGDPGLSVVRLAIANYTATEISITINLPVEQLYFMAIDEGNVEMAMKNKEHLQESDFALATKTGHNFTFTIKPYGIVYGKDQ